jgi:hypothetical protein
MALSNSWPPNQDNGFLSYKKEKEKMIQKYENIFLDSFFLIIL